MTLRLTFFGLLTAGALAATLAAGASAASAPLVLQTQNAPGLSPAPAGATAARGALGTALSPATAPGNGAPRSAASHFRGQGAELWSNALVFQNSPTAQRALSAAIAGASRAKLTRIRVGVGNQGWLLQRSTAPRPAVVLWRRERAVGAIVFRASVPNAALRTAVIRYAKTADFLLEHALTETPFDQTVAEIRPDGTVTRSTALKLFALAYKPLPGTSKPSGPSERVEPMLAARAVLSNWSGLTAAQQAAAKQAMGLKAVNLGRKKRFSSASARPDATPAPRYGDRTFIRDPRVEAEARRYAAFFAQRMGISRPLRFQIVGGTSQAITGITEIADAYPILPDGTLDDAAPICRVRLLGFLSVSAGFQETLRTIAHEVFHCWQFDLMGATGALSVNRRNWLLEGSAEWAGIKAVPGSWAETGGWTRDYILTPSRPLFTRTYDAVGFFGHSEDVLGDLFPRMPSVLQTGSSEATYSAAGGGRREFLDTWSASTFNLSSRLGRPWSHYLPVPLPSQLVGEIEPLAVSRSVVRANPYTVARYEIAPENYPPKKPLLHIRISGNGRLATKAFDTTDLGDRWFCLQDKCECPEGTEGNPPPAPPLRADPVANLAVTGGQSGTNGLVTVAALEEYCKKKEKKPPPPPKAPPITTPAGGGGGGGGPASSGCTSGCGGSNGDPHLTTFDGRFYDFQGAGEFTLVRSSDGSLEVQVREEPYPGSTTLAINTAVAFKVGANRIVVSRGKPLTIRLNGRGLVASARAFPLPGGGTIAMAGGELQVTWPDLSVARLWSVSSWGVAVLVKPVDARKGQFAGLLGDFDGSQDNDFKTRSGKVLDASKVAGSREQLYGVFGESWRVTPQSSLFDYAPGESTRTFTDRGFPKEVVTVTSLSPQQRRAAEAVCRGLGITDRRIFDACVLDVAGTGDSTFATAGAQLQRTGVSFGSGAPGGGGGATGGDRRWTPIATGGSSNSIGLSVAVDGGKVVVAYTLGPSAESATFTPSLSQDIVGGRRDTLTSGWDLVSDPILLPGSGGGLQALFAGLSASGNPPSGAYLAPRNPDGSFGSAARALTEPAVGGAAVLAPDGQPLWAAARLGLTISRGSSNASQVQVPEAGGTPYIPSIGRDGMGRYWLVWYALGSPNGLRIVQIDPANGRRLSAPIVVPGSAGIENSSIRLALACAQTCRLVYLSSQRVVSWAPGESAPTVVAQGGDPGSFLAAVYLPNGRLWAAWYDRRQQTYRAVSGDAAGRGGSPVSIGRPPGGANGFAIAAAAVGDSVVVVSNWQVGGSAFGRFVNVVRP